MKEPQGYIMANGLARRVEKKLITRERANEILCKYNLII